MIKEIIIDSLLDCVTLFPFLLATYLLLEFIEQKSTDKSLNLIRNTGRLGPVFGGLVGLIPQCGFAAAASNFYAARAISTGTLLAVFLTTSDEMLPILISNAVSPTVIVKLLLIKLVIGIGVGILYDLCQRQQGSVVDVEALCEQDDCHCESGSILRSAMYHAVKITAFILLVTLGLNTVMFLLGHQFLHDAVFEYGFLGPIIAALVGMLPNCTASVALTQLWIEGAINTGSLLAGLLSGGGVGLLVLFRVNPYHCESWKIAGVLYVVAVFFGILAEFLQINL